MGEWRQEHGRRGLDPIGTFLLGGGGKLGRGETREASKRTTLPGGAGFQSPMCTEQSEGLSALVPAIKLIQEIAVVIPKRGGKKPTGQK